jgi:phage terminase large subunit-like protein
MPVPTEACDATFPFTGAEDTFNSGFRAKAVSHVKAKFTDGDGAVSVLVNPTHFTVALDPTTEVATVTRVLFPAASGSLYVWRDTPATQDDEFNDLEDFPGATHTDVADRGAMRDAELRRDQAAILAAAEDLDAAVTQAEAAADIAAGHAASASADKDQTALDVIATAADRVQTGLDVIAAAASAALAAANSENPAFSFKWNIDTAASDPGSAYVKGNNAALGSITAIYISETSLEGPIGGFITAMMSSVSAIKATVVLLKLSDPENWVAVDVTAHSDDGDFRTLTCTNLGANGLFALDDDLGFFVTRSGPPGSGLGSIVEDPTPQWGGMMDPNGFAIGDGTRELLKFEETASAVNELTIKNAATGNAPELKATGDDANINVKLTPKGTGIVEVGSDPVLLGGLHLIGCWAAGDLLLSTTDGADAAAQAETTTNKLNYEYVNFPNAATKYAELSFPAPKCLNEGGTLSVEIEWTEAASATAHVCRWQAEAQAQGDGDTLDSAWGTAVADDDTGSSGTRRKVLLSAITPGGTWAVNDTIHLRIARLGGHANDTLDVGARLVRAIVYASVNKKNDA